MNPKDKKPTAPDKSSLAAKLAAARAERAGSPSDVIVMPSAPETPPPPPSAPHAEQTAEGRPAAKPAVVRLSRPAISPDKPVGSSLDRIRQRIASGKVERVPVEVTAEFLDLAGKRIAAVMQGSRPPKPAELAQAALVIAENFFAPNQDGSPGVSDREVALLWCETIRRKSERASRRRIETLTQTALPVE